MFPNNHAEDLKGGSLEIEVKLLDIGACFA